MSVFDVLGIFAAVFFSTILVLVGMIVVKLWPPGEMFADLAWMWRERKRHQK